MDLKIMWETHLGLVVKLMGPPPPPLAENFKVLELLSMSLYATNCFEMSKNLRGYCTFLHPHLRCNTAFKNMHDKARHFSAGLVCYNPRCQMWTWIILSKSIHLGGLKSWNPEFTSWKRSSTKERKRLRFLLPKHWANRRPIYWRSHIHYVKPFPTLLWELQRLAKIHQI